MSFQRNLKMFALNSIIFINLFTIATSEVFTSIADCEYLLDTHDKIIGGLNEYVHKEELRLATLKQQLEKYKHEHEMALGDIPNYLGNPLNVFTLIKRLTVDLDNIEKSIKTGTEYFKTVTRSQENVTYPTSEDLDGAAAALRRLQVTYKLDIEELAQGILNHVAYSSPLSAGDCFELGRLSYDEADYNNSIAWMEEALQKYKLETNTYYTFTEIDIYDFISYAYFLMDQPRIAIDWLNRLLEVDPNHIRRLNMPMFETKLHQMQQEENVMEHLTNSKPHVITKDDVTYEPLCRGELGLPDSLYKELFCFYKSDKPFLKLAPIKAEQRYKNPDVFIFYDVISDDEIEYVKNAAKPRFQRALVNSRTGELVPATYRISKSAWLRDEVSPVVARLSRRISDFTGLSMDHAEELQVANYGIGGHYSPHYDFARRLDENQNFEFPGRRIATVLFYLSEVSQGGATVFTELGIGVYPVKNAALFWMNLHPSGEGDLATRHAACPVLRGSKWVANKWIHEGGQEFLRPCSLEFQPEAKIRQYPRPVYKKHDKKL